MKRSLCLYDWPNHFKEAKVYFFNIYGVVGNSSSQKLHFFATHVGHLVVERR
jgi:hypothetical protein